MSADARPPSTRWTKSCSAATTEDYIAVAEISGQDQSGFLKDWLYGTQTPRMPNHPDWTVTPVTPVLVAPRHREPGHYPDSTATP